MVANLHFLYYTNWMTGESKEYAPNGITHPYPEKLIEYTDVDVLAFCDAVKYAHMSNEMEKDMRATDPQSPQVSHWITLRQTYHNRVRECLLKLTKRPEFLQRLRRMI